MKNNLAGNQFDIYTEQD